MESMASYILSILKSSSMIMWSWGIHSFVALEGNKGLSFMVNGFAYKGKVTVAHNTGNDTFSVIIGNETSEDIYFDELVEFIDSHVEKDCTDSMYANKVRNWFQSDEYKEMFGYNEE